MASSTGNSACASICWVPRRAALRAKGVGCRPPSPAYRRPGRAPSPAAPRRTPPCRSETHAAWPQCRARPGWPADPAAYAFAHAGQHMHLLRLRQQPKGCEHGADGALVVPPGDRDAFPERRRRTGWHQQHRPVGVEQRRLQLQPIGGIGVPGRPAEDEIVRALAPFADQRVGQALDFSPFDNDPGSVHRRRPGVEGGPQCRHPRQFVAADVRGVVESESPR